MAVVGQPGYGHCLREQPFPSHWQSFNFEDVVSKVSEWHLCRINAEFRFSGSGKFNIGNRAKVLVVFHNSEFMNFAIQRDVDARFALGPKFNMEFLGPLSSWSDHCLSLTGTHIDFPSIRRNGGENNLGGRDDLWLDV